ncbi:hypothetical protein LC612_18030 [Nostoc sp. CHAB 5834]|nr:hypothetical protein [Nostoc sp. CHAB 5834]
MNSNVRDPRVNNGDWKAIALLFNSELRVFNSNIRDPRVNDSELGAIASVIIRLADSVRMSQIISFVVIPQRNVIPLLIAKVL